MVVVLEQVGRSLREGESAEFGVEGCGEGGAVVGRPDPLDEGGGLGGIVEDHGFDLAALAVVF